MGQTEASKQALLRDANLCQWCFHTHDRIRDVFAWVEGYHSAYGGTHHVFKRSRVDTPETIISLCSECHYKAEHAFLKKREIVALLSKIGGVDLFKKYRSECKWNEEDWAEVYP